MAYSVAQRICDALREKLKSVEVRRFSDSTEPAKAALRDVLLELLKGSGEEAFYKVLDERKSQHKAAIVLFVGVNGTGKTSSIAKIGSLLLKRGYSVVIAAADTYRTGSIEQIEEHARRIGIRTMKHDYGADSAAVASRRSELRKCTWHQCCSDRHGWQNADQQKPTGGEKKIARVAKPDLTILVADALTGNDAVEQAQKFSESVSIDGVVMTKLDADVKGGSAISMAAVIGRPILFATVGQNYEDILSFEPDQMVHSILG